MVNKRDFGLSRAGAAFVFLFYLCFACFIHYLFKLPVMRAGPDEEVSRQIQVMLGPAFTGGTFMFSGLALAVVPAIVRAHSSTLFEKFCFVVGGASAVGGCSYFLARIISLPLIREALQEQLQRFNLLTGSFAAPTLTTILFVIGCLLFWLKVKRLMLYASVELCFALATCLYITEKTSHELALGTATAFGAAGYLVVRGLDNLRKALQERGLL